MQITDEKTERFNRAARLACDIIEECRVQLMLKFRFLDLALWRMELVPVHSRSRYPLSTDGKAVYFEPFSVLARFEESFDEAVRDYLHMILHCVFRHPYNDDFKKNPDAWSLACDIIVETVAMEMCATRFLSEDDKAREGYASQLKTMTNGLMPGKLFHLLDSIIRHPEGSSYLGFSKSDITQMQYLFERDNHESWPARNEGEKEEKPGDIEEIADQPMDDGDVPEDSSHDLQSISDADLGQYNPKDEMQNESLGSDEGAQEGGEDESDEVGSSGEASSFEANDEDLQGSSTEEETDSEVEDENSSQEKDWDEIAKQIEMNLGTFSKEWSDEARGLIQCLAIANRRKYDYSDFLRRFATLSEDMYINDDEYDYIFYTYGLKLYGNMPLIEPLEYKDTNRVRDFVIAVDTSESVSGDLVKRFIEHTFDILLQAKDFGNTVNIHIIQCDAQVQADTKITKREELKSYLDGFHIRGFGGTDFRPVFDYIGDLQKRGELQDLQGMLYFTDGKGTYPEKMPKYETAFVFLDTGEEHTPNVPPWAMKIVIDEEGINKFKSRMRV